MNIVEANIKASKPTADIYNSSSTDVQDASVYRCTTVLYIW